MLKLRKSGIDAPIPYYVDLKSNLIYMEYIEGMSVRDYIVSTRLSEDMGRGNSFSQRRVIFKELLHLLMLLSYVENALAAKIGTSLGKMHANNIIHGDLTTSNMVLRDTFSETSSTAATVPEYDVVLIDLGLSYVSTLSEDKGVDLYVLERAFISTHPNSERMFDRVLEAYGKACGSFAKEILKRYEEVKMRGRKKVAFG
jgi:TP53 regulating kinase and related kinases